MKTYDPYEHINEHERQHPNDSLKKLRRDRGKIEEFVSQLSIALERRGGTVEDLFDVLSGDILSSKLGKGANKCINNIADYIMGTMIMEPIEAYDVVTRTGKSDFIRALAVPHVQHAEALAYLCISSPGFTYPRTRVAIVECVTDQAKLKEIALKGGRDDGELATSKLTSPDDLYDVAMVASYQSTALVAVSRLSPEYLLRLVAPKTRWENDNRKHEIQRVALAILTKV